MYVRAQFKRPERLASDLRNCNEVISTFCCLFSYKKQRTMLSLAKNLTATKKDP